MSKQPSPNFHEVHAPYLGLNNLDLLDERGTLNPYASEEATFDESGLPEEYHEAPRSDWYEEPNPNENLSLDEVYAGASEEDFKRLTSAAFNDGLVIFRNTLPPYQTSQTLKQEGNPSPRTLVANSIRWVASYIREHHHFPVARVAMLDRIQNGNLYLLEAVQKYDASRDASLIAMSEPLLGEYVRRPERSGRGIKSATPIVQGDLIRIPNSTGAYHRVKQFHEGRSRKFGWQLDDAEIEMLSDFTAAELEEYQELRVEYVSFHRILGEDGEPTEEFVEGCLDEDPLVNPYEAASARFPHAGITAALNVLSADQSAVLVARAGLHARDGLIHSQVASELGLNSAARARSAYLRAADKLRGISNIKEVVNGLSELPDETEDSEPAEEIQVELINESLLVRRVRRLLRRRGGVMSQFSSMGISPTVLQEEAQLHPSYAEEKINGQAFMTDEEATRLVTAASTITRQNLGLSLYQLAPLRSELINQILDKLGAEAAE